MTGSDSLELIQVLNKIKDMIQANGQILYSDLAFNIDVFIENYSIYKHKNTTQKNHCIISSRCFVLQNLAVFKKE